MDPLNDNVVQLFTNSSDSFVAQLWKDTANVVGMQASESAAAAGKFGVQKTRKGMFRTVGQLYKVRWRGPFYRGHTIHTLYYLHIFVGLQI